MKCSPLPLTLLACAFLTTTAEGLGSDGPPVSVRLRNGERIEGRLTAPRLIGLLVRGGRLDLPPTSISRITFAVEPGRATVTLRNGDELTGRIDSPLTVRTSGRTARLRVGRISEVRLQPRLRRPRPRKRSETPLDSSRPVILAPDIFWNWPGLPTWHAQTGRR